RRHSIVAIGVVGRNTAFVAPEDFYSSPVYQGWLGGQDHVELTGRRATRKSHHPPVSTLDRIGRSLDQSPRCCLGDLGGTRQDHDLAIHERSAGRLRSVSTRPSG